jgi:hypothetical protein
MLARINAHVRICAGGGQQWSSLPRQLLRESRPGSASVIHLISGATPVQRPGVLGSDQPDSGLRGSTSGLRRALFGLVAN